MKTQKWLKQVAHIGKSTIEGDEDSDIWYSNFDGSYITRVGMEKDVRFLASRGITDDLTHGVGFSPTEGKWYGWSHRAIFGFKVGSTCKKGDCHYKAANIEDEMEAAIAFWDDEGRLETKASVSDDGIIMVTWKYSDTIINKELRGTIHSVEWSYDDLEDFGRGEWVAETMEDAKEMAEAFNEGVS